MNTTQILDRRAAMDRQRLQLTLRRTIIAAMALMIPGSAGAQDLRRSATDSLALAVTIYRVAFSNGTQTAHGVAKPELVCVRGNPWTADPPLAIVDSLQRGTTHLLRPNSACRQDRPTSAARGVSLVVDTLTGKRGISIAASEPVFSADGTFTFETNYYEHGLSSASWDCSGRRVGPERWEIVACRLTRIS